jgi:ATP adenylyltransferase
VDLLWAPWRSAYIAKSVPSASDECFICTGLEAHDDRANLIALRTARCAVMLNRFPYNNGHLLVAPRAHKGELHDLAPEETSELMETLSQMVRLVREILQPDGFNIGLNLGRAAGAGLPGHLHWHIVPRWSGDTNFMPILGDAKVISQSLDAFWDMLTRKTMPAAGDR